MALWSFERRENNTDSQTARIDKLGLNANQIRVYKTTQSQPVLIAPTHLKFIRLNNQGSHALVGLFDQSPQIENIWNLKCVNQRHSFLLDIHFQIPICILVQYYGLFFLRSKRVF